jgi:hypothetical protein
MSCSTACTLKELTKEIAANTLVTDEQAAATAANTLKRLTTSKS